MRIPAASLGLVVMVSQGFGCVGAVEEPGAEEPVGVAASAQLDSGSKTYTLTQGGVVTAMAWAGNVGGVPTEYWVSNSSYASTTARTFTEASQTCSGFRDAVCGSSWKGSRYFQAAYTQSTLDCGFPPGPCSPPVGAVSFLGAGSYQTADASGTSFAWTYSTGHCEYWAMGHTISTGTNTQSPLSPAYTSLSQFETSVCAMSPAPTVWYTVDYLPDTHFCSSPRC